MCNSSRENITAAFTDIIQDVTDHLSQIGVPSEGIERLSQCILANTQGGNVLRGRTVVDTGFILNGHSLSREETQELMTLGCLIEIFNAAYLIWDDIMDDSQTRHGQICWYRREGVGMMAVNDACLLKSTIFVILRRRFRNHPAYLELLELFFEASLRTELGQHQDLMASEKLLRLDQLTWNKYEFISAFKTAYYTFYVPLAIPMIYLRLDTPRKLNKLYRISVLLGLLFQSRDDFLDVYGDPEITGKVGTDIQDHKWTWLLMEALKHCSAEERAILQSAYGSQDNQNISKVRMLFEHLSLPKLFREWDEMIRAAINNGVQEIDKEEVLPNEAFTVFLSKYFDDPRRDVSSSVCSA
ncbi:isoprenoid synthase domain-containing protein [Aspergillus alliaceus]|uniref:Isoprenoid synthase domain-containing protein n=1 Tax=Petromyces alliaceus TaxID=209559 RepID=A0A5N7BR21_PETAA|nr:isoprenoid synthase domain-containing protein [Aspergillus alliaceus]